jgi:hypothetical protein
MNMRSGNTNVLGSVVGTLTNGHCVSIDSNMNLIDAGGACTVGGGGGTVNSATAGQLTYYAATGNAVVGNGNATISGGALTLGVPGTAAGSLILSGSGSGSSTISVSATGALTLPTLTVVPSLNASIAPSGTLPSKLSNYVYQPLAVGIISTADNGACAASTCETSTPNIPSLLDVEQNFGGSNINSGRNAGNFLQNFTAATSATNPYRFYVALNAFENVTSADNGTVGTPAGDFEGITSQVQLSSSATNLFAAIGVEVNLSAQTGSTVANKAYLAMNGFPADAVHGSNVDTYIWTYGQGGVGAATWAQLDQFGGTFPLATTGTLINILTSSTIGYGINFGNAVITNNVLQWKSTGGTWSLSGLGNAVLAGVLLENLNYTPGSVSVGGCTGLGSGACSLATGSSIGAGKIILSPAGSPSGAGAATLTFSFALNVDDTVCQFNPQNGTAAWTTPPTTQAQASSTTTHQVRWENGAGPTNLTPGSTYWIEYTCIGI